MSFPSSRTLGLVLGTIFALFGVAEVVAHRGDEPVAIAFWGISLLGGGALVLIGTLLRPTRRTMGLTLLTVGALIATNATVWTLLLPIFTVVAVVSAYRERGLEDLPAPKDVPAPGQPL